MSNTNKCKIFLELKKSFLFFTLNIKKIAYVYCKCILNFKWRTQNKQKKKNRKKEKRNNRKAKKKQQAKKIWISNKILTFFESVSRTSHIEATIFDTSPNEAFGFCPLMAACVSRKKSAYADTGFCGSFGSFFFFFFGTFCFLAAFALFETLLSNVPTTPLFEYGCCCCCCWCKPSE